MEDALRMGVSKMRADLPFQSSFWTRIKMRNKLNKREKLILQGPGLPIENSNRAQLIIK